MNKLYSFFLKKRRCYGTKRKMIKRNDFPDFIKAINKTDKDETIKALYKRIKDLEEINESHQKLNGKLRTQIKEFENDRKTTATT